MNSIMDIVGSVLIGGVFFLLMINLNGYTAQSKFSSDSELKLLNDAKTLADIVNNDLRKIGFKYSGQPIITADKKKLSFYADIDNNGSMDLVTYILSDSLKASGTQNPRDKILYRIVNGDTSKGPSLGIVDLQFSYKDKFGNNTNNLSNVTYIKAELWIEATEKIDSNYSFTYWEMTINPRNL